MLPAPYVVRKWRRETADTVTIGLSPEGGGPAPEFQPGQFHMLYAFGVGEAAISISGDPARRDEATHTIRAVGSVTRALTSTRPGALVGLRGPYGTAWPVEAAEGADIAFVAGGIGLAPLRPAVRAVLARRERYGRVALLYGARTPDDQLYKRELARLRGRFDVDVDATVDRAPAGYRGKVGVVTRLIPRTEIDPRHTIALVCGPEVMMRFAARALLERGVPPERIYLSLERSMRCGVGWCGHCQLGPLLLCRDGPVVRYDLAERLMAVREL
jgi:NAD(P)H-flavin reductase